MSANWTPVDPVAKEMLLVERLIRIATYILTFVGGMLFVLVLQ